MQDSQDVPDVEGEGRAAGGDQSPALSEDDVDAGADDEQARDAGDVNRDEDPPLHGGADVSGDGSPRTVGTRVSYLERFFFPTPAVIASRLASHDRAPATALSILFGESFRSL